MCISSGALAEQLRREAIYRLFSWSSSFYLGTLLGVITILPKTTFPITNMFKVFISIGLLLIAFAITTLQASHRITEYKYWKVLIDVEKKLGFERLGLAVGRVPAFKIEIEPSWTYILFGPRGFNILTFSLALLDILAVILI